MGTSPLATWRAPVAAALLLSLLAACGAPPAPGDTTCAECGDANGERPLAVDPAGPTDAGQAGQDPSATDAGLCHSGLVDNGSFECGLAGWLVLDGDGQVLVGSAQAGAASLEVVADARGRARVALAAPLSFAQETTVCASFWVRGTAPTVQLEVLTTPASVRTTFAAPVFSTWTKVPPSSLSVGVPFENQAWLIIRATGAAAGDRLQLDALEVHQAVGGRCNP